MSDVVPFPPITVTVGQIFELLGRIDDPTLDPPTISLTGWTVAWSLSEKPFDTPFLTGAGEIIETDGGSRFSIAISDTITATLGEQAVPIIGGRPTAKFQIILTAPIPESTIVMQGSAIIAGTF